MCVLTAVWKCLLNTAELPLPVVSLNTQYIYLSVQDLPSHSTSICTLMPKKPREINVTHQWFTFGMITGLNLLSRRYCWECTNEMLSLLQHKPSLHDECELHVNKVLTCFDLKLRDVSPIKPAERNRHTLLFSSQQNKLSNCPSDSRLCKNCF